MFWAWIILFAGVYQFFFASFAECEGFISTVVFKFFPCIVGSLLVLKGLFDLGFLRWIT